MSFKQMNSFLASLVIAGCLIGAPLCAYGDEYPMATEKVETVNVKTDAKGAVESVEVDNLLTNESGATELADSTTLTEIECDDAEFRQTDTGLVWIAEGKNVSYSGKTSKQLPVSIKVTYKLDGEEIEPADLAGKSGRVSIRYDYANNNAFYAYVNQMTVDMYTPFTCITAVMLDGDNFSNVTADNAKIMNDGSDIIVTGYSMPGFKESLGSLAKDIKRPGYFEVTADVKEFELKSTMTMVTAGLLTDLDLESMGFDDMNDASEGLSSGIEELISGSDDLTSGMYDLADGATQLRIGTEELSSGLVELSDGMWALAYGEDGASGLEGAANSSEELVGYLQTFGESLDAFADESAGLPAVASGLSQLAQAYPSESEAEALIMAIEMDPNLDANVKMALQGIVESTGTVKELADAVEQSSEGAVSLSQNYAELVQEAGALPDGLRQAAEGAAQLYEGSSELVQGAWKLSDGANELEDGIWSAADGSGSLEDGLVTYNEEGVSEVVSTIDNDLGGLKKRLNILSEESGAYDTFTGKLDGTPSSVKFVFETAAISAD